jgi:hypothetical protein
MRRTNKMELHPRALEIAELAAPDACTQSKRLIASQIHQAMQQARAEALDEAANHIEPLSGTYLVLKALNNAAARIRDLKTQQKA